MFGLSVASFAVIITALDETWSLRETTDCVVAENRDHVTDIVIATAPHTTAACRAVVEEMKEKHPSLVRGYQQERLPGVGGAIQECVDNIRADWTIFASADLETPPDKIKDLIARAKKGDVDIVATSRWLDDGNFGDYSRLKLLCNWIFQKLFSFLYRTPMTDMTFGYRAYRTALLRRCLWRETGHAFFMESLVKPLRAGARVTEVPVSWRKRREGESHIKLSEFLRYFRIGFAVRFTDKRSFLK